MTKISKSVNLYTPQTFDDFNNKIDKIYHDLETGKMWLHKDCKTVAKNSKFVRFIKCILSIILPLNLYSSIKADKAALNFFQMIKVNIDHLKNYDTKNTVINIITKLDTLTQKKHTLLLGLILDTKHLSINNDQSQIIDNTSLQVHDMSEDEITALRNKIIPFLKEKHPFVPVEQVVNLYDTLIKTEKKINLKSMNSFWHKMSDSHAFLREKGLDKSTEALSDEELQKIKDEAEARHIFNNFNDLMITTPSEGYNNSLTGLHIFKVLTEFLKENS